MKCLTCQNELPDTAISCPRCGTSTHAATSFSYLPEGAPPWPATVSGTATAVKQMVEPLSPSKAKSVPDAKPRRSVGSIFTAMLLLILSVVVGVGITLAILAANGYLVSPGTTTRQAAHLVVPSPTAAATTGTGTPVATPTTGTAANQLPTPSSFVVAKITQMGFSLKYPASWTQDAPRTDSNGNLSVEIHPSQQLPFDFAVGQLSAQNSAGVTSTTEVNQANIQGFGTGQKLTNMQVLTNTPQHANIGGLTWDEQDATFNVDNNGNVVHVVSISVKHNDHYYNIFYFAPTTNFDEAMQKYYSQMLTSFQFLS
jgi:hypothetical protein